MNNIDLKIAVGDLIRHVQMEGALVQVKHFLQLPTKCLNVHATERTNSNLQERQEIYELDYIVRLMDPLTQFFRMGLVKWKGGGVLGELKGVVKHQT